MHTGPHITNGGGQVAEPVHSPEMQNAPAGQT